MKRVEREGAVVLSPIELTTMESELVGNATSINPYEPLMHYMKFEDFMHMITSECLHTRRLDTYEDDPLEGLYLYPMVAAMRPLVDYSGEIAKWKVDRPLDVFCKASNEMVKKLLTFAAAYGRKPNAVGKNLLVWSSLYEKIENELLTVENALLRAQAAKK